MSFHGRYKNTYNFDLLDQTVLKDYDVHYMHRPEFWTTSKFVFYLFYINIFKQGRNFLGW